LGGGQLIDRDLVYVVHPTPAVAAKLSGGLEAAQYEVVSMTSVDEAQSITDARQFDLPDAILTPLADVESGDSMLISLYQSNPLMEQIPLVVVASSESDERRRALRMGLLSVVLPPYDGEEVALTTKLAIEKHRSDQLLFGSLTQLSVPDLLQTAEAGRRSGTVTFMHNDEKGTMWMRDGFIIDAEVENDCGGVDAVYAMAVWDTGTFEANFGGVDVEEKFRKPPSSLLLEAMRRFDEESAGTVPVPVLDEGETEILDISLVLLNVVAGYCLNHLNASLIHKRLEKSWQVFCVEHPSLETFEITDEGTVIMAGAAPADLDERDLVRAVGKLVVDFFKTMEGALAWRFTPQRLARLLAPWRERLLEVGFLEVLGISETVEDSEEDSHESIGVAGKPVPVGCLVIDGAGVVESFSQFGPRIGRLDPAVVLGRTLNDILPENLAVLADRLTRQVVDRDEDADGLAIGRNVMQIGHSQHVVRIAVVRPASKKGFVVAINRLRDQRRALSPEIERDPMTGSLRDSQSDRLLVANQDFLQAFEGLFSKSLSHRHHELLQRFGKKWGLRHAMRLEHVVQRDYRMTLREMESQMSLEMMSASVGVFGLGRFDAVLDYRDSGLIVIHHQASPFPGIFETTASGACSILSGFHAALLSYLAGRNLAAREVRCSLRPGDPCIFVVGTEERLTKLVIAVPGSPDNQLLQEIVGKADAGGVS
jgi:CheY-like chemotaxis protein/predicted hydrocarbon binding protein